MSLEYLITWLMVCLRAVGVVLLLPEFSGRTPPAMVRVGLMVCLATLVAGLVPVARMPDTIWDLAFAAAGEVLLGLALGFIGRLVFGAVEFAGRLISSEVGLSAAPGFGSPTAASEPLATLLSTFAVIIFFLMGGHLAAISAFARSFVFAPPGRAAVSPGAADQIVVATAHLIEVGVRMTLPFLALNFLVTMAFAVLGRALPRTQVFIISASVRSVSGLGLLAAAGTLLARHLAAEFTDLPIRMLQLVAFR